MEDVRMLRMKNMGVDGTKGLRRRGEGRGPVDPGLRRRRSCTGRESLCGPDLHDGRSARARVSNSSTRPAFAAM